MKRIFISLGVLALLGSTTSVLAATAVAASRAPIVSPKADPYYRYGLNGREKGFGQVKPREIYYGGDESSIVCNIHWKSWGGQIASGAGTGFYLGPNQFTYQGHFTHVVVVASKLGTWKGRSAYNKLTWSSPSHGRVREHC